MARVIISTKDKKPVSREGARVTAHIGVVSGNEYYELAINAFDQTDDSEGLIVVTKISSKDATPKEVYRVPVVKKVRKKAPTQSSGTPESQDPAA